MKILQNTIYAKSLIKDKNIKSKKKYVLLKKNLTNIFFIRFFLKPNCEILSRKDTKLKNKIQKKIAKIILKLRQKKILLYSI